MEQPSSTENLMATAAPVLGNMANLCLLCANAQNPEGQAFVDIHGQFGTELKILEKIHKFLAITIEAGFPLQVCVSCVGKLNVCHELAQSSEKAYEKFKSLREEWEANPSTKAQDPLDDMDDDAWSPMDVDVPSPESITEEGVPVESQELETDQQPKKGIKKKSAKKKKTVEENELEEYLMLQQPSLMVKGSQIAFAVAEEDGAVKGQCILGLVLINMAADYANNKEKITEQISRIVPYAKKRLASKDVQNEEKDKSSPNKILPIHSCQSCKCSFFLQEEMVSHFESLHPEEVHQCTVCEEKICGPVQMQEKHMELHRALEKGQTDYLLSTLRVPSGSTNIFDPEFVIAPLGDYPPRLIDKTVQILKSKYLAVIRRNKWIKPDMKIKLSGALRIFISKIKLYERVRKGNPKSECTICGKEMQKKSLEGHMKFMHNPEKMNCLHCGIIYMACDENYHLESHHNGGKNLICKICDTKFNESGEDQPHMIPKSDFPFKCPSKNCRNAYQSEANLEKHSRTAHISKQDAPPCLCELCGKVYRDKSGLKTHLTKVHFPNKTAAYICDICGASYAVLNSLRHHKIGHHEPKVPCNVCGKLYNRRRLIDHMKLHTEVPSIPCKYCGRLFNSRINCSLHEQRRHEGVKLRCIICKDLCFKSVKALQEHNARHERGEEVPLPRYLLPVQCSICSSVCRNSVKLAQHMKKHQIREVKNVRVIKGREETVPCYPCLLRFMTQESYDQHVKTYHPDGAPNVFTKPKGSRFRYQCRYCEKNFLKKHFCNDHETTHGSGKQYACDFCSKRYSYYSDKGIPTQLHWELECPKILENT